MAAAENAFVAVVPDLWKIITKYILGNFSFWVNYKIHSGFTLTDTGFDTEPDTLGNAPILETI